MRTSPAPTSTDWTRSCETVDNNLNDSTRATANKKADGLTASAAISMPLDPLPDIVLWQKTVVGPVGDNAILGPWWNVQDWGIKS